MKRHIGTGFVVVGIIGVIGEPVDVFGWIITGISFLCLIYGIKLEAKA